MTEPNFLILDEPTNDLDIVTLNTLEEFLMGFGGCLIIVSHDRYFLNKLCDHLFAFEGDCVIKDFPGNYSQYREAKAVEAQEKAKAKKAKAKTEVEPKKDNRVYKREEKKLSYKETREYEGLEGEIEKLETQKEELLAQLTAAGTDYEVIQTLSAELKSTEEQLETKSDRWLELAERMEEA